MNDQLKKSLREYISMSLSIGVHIAILYIISTYDIHNIGNKSNDLPSNTEITEISKDKTRDIEGQLTIYLKSFKEDPSIKRIGLMPPSTKKTTDKQKTPTIDQRGIYKPQNNVAHNDDSDNVKLNLQGWIWDSSPTIIDDSKEIGKIVFEITVDEVGEIIKIKTLESTVSNSVEQIYRNAVSKLTFSQTTAQPIDGITKGTITFILKYES